MKSGKLGFFVVLLLLSSSTCLAWFGSSSSKPKISSSSSNGRNSILSYEQPSSSSSSSSPSFLNRFRSGSSVVFPVHGNVYPVGYVKGTSFFLHSLCFSFFLFPSVSLYAFLSSMLFLYLFLFGPPCFVLLFYSSKSNLNNKTSLYYSHSHVMFFFVSFIHKLITFF